MKRIMEQHGIKHNKQLIASYDTVKLYYNSWTLRKEYTVVVKGDVNKDGKVKIFDAFQILKDALVQGTELTEIDCKIRDFNGDGQVRIYDAFQFLKQAILS